MGNYYVAKDRFGDYDLSHYGIKGQKWGIRRFQNEDGTLTAEGRKRARKEYRDDNSKAFQLGAATTVYQKSTEFPSKRIDKLLSKMDKEIESHEGETKRYKRLEQKLKTEIEVANYLNSKSSMYQSKTKAHYDKLVGKYGKEAVSDIAYDKNGKFNERLYHPALKAVVLLWSLPCPPAIPIVLYGLSKHNAAFSEYSITKTAVKKLLKRTDSLYDNNLHLEPTQIDKLVEELKVQYARNS
jgi:hypothetical protein